MTRGVLYVYWGEKIRPELERSLKSLRRHHPELPVEEVKLPDGSNLLNKAALLDYSPFDSTLFLDTDTVVLDRLDFGFSQAERHGLACCICECPWARRYGGLHGDMVEYNTGVLFFTRAAQPVFDLWRDYAGSVDSSIRWIRKGEVVLMPHNDQAGFAKAVADSGFNPYVLPMNWNLRPGWQRTFFGPIKIWHDRADVPLHLRFWNEDQTLEQSIIRYSGDS